MINKDNVLTLMESLALVVQDSAETGNMDPSIYADMANLLAYLANLAKTLTGSGG